MPLRVSALLLVLLVTPLVAHAQETEEEAVLATIIRLFDGMRAGDSTIVRSVFHEEAVLGRSGQRRDGTPGFRKNDLNGFLTAIGTPHDQVWDEKIWDPVILVEQGLAMAWTPYAFFLGEHLSHCGVNSIQLVKTGDGWKIVHLVDVAQRQGCDLPDDL